MNTEHRNIDTLAGYSQPSNGNAAYGAAPADGPRRVVQVPRRLNDSVQFSKECSGDDSSAGDLCSNFMAAWG